MDRPRWLSALDDGGFLVDASAFPAEPAVMVCLDTASKDRLGPLAGNASHAAEVIVLDHHRTNPGFGTIDVIDPGAAATGELVFRLAERMDAAIPDQAAPCLYAALVTDTGRFQYGATTPETLRIAAELRRHPFDHAALAQALYEDGSLGYLRVLGWSLDRLTYEPEARMVWTYVLQSDLERAGVDAGETDDLIDAIRVAREADVACLLKQQRDGRFKVSLRSRGGSDVAAIAVAGGGGGHRLAAGYTAPGGVEETIAQISAALRAATVDA
jgi:phosphoesterase RecJ-like protein